MWNMAFIVAIINLEELQYNLLLFPIIFETEQIELTLKLKLIPCPLQ